MAVVALAWVLAAASAQDYAIGWHTVDGGGGASTNGQYSVTGTIGQFDAGILSGGRFILEGGFWGGAVAVQTPGAPRLTIMQTEVLVVVSWLAPADGWQLERTNTLPSSSADWPTVFPPYQTNAGVISVRFPRVSASTQFFRLHRP